jgi:glycosyltransferase involved in cell wall biosynthesis
MCATDQQRMPDGAMADHMTTRPRILAWAYACEPDTGSEPGAGWVWPQILAGIGETWVVVGPDRRPGWKAWVEERLAALPPSERPRHVYVDIPEGIQRILAAFGIGRASAISYMVWQFAALGATRRLLREQRFDVIWHLTYANVWLGSLAAIVGPAFVFGPVGGGVGPPWRLVPALGVRGIFSEVARTITRALARHLNPLARISWMRARLILVQNPETRDWLPAGHRKKAIVLPHVVVDQPSAIRATSRHEPPTALFAARLEPLKGGALALRAISLLPPWHLIICGTGSDEARLRRLCQRLGLASRVRFTGWVARSEVLRLMREEADVFLFPSLHDEGGWVVSEAIANGLSVICLDRGGPPVLGGSPVHASTPDATIRALADAMRSIPQEPPAPERRDIPTIRARLVDLLVRVELLPTPSDARPVWHRGQEPDSRNTSS